MEEIKYKPEHTKDPQCAADCPAGIDECVECGACDHCEHGAVLIEEDLPPNWRSFIERSKQQD